MGKKFDLTLLYVEDEDSIRQNAIEFLSDQFIEIYEARDAKEALEIYYSKRPDIIITDINMPKINGLELCKKIREKNSSIPIIIITAFTDQSYLLQAIELNLVKYITKPIDEYILNSALEQCAKKLKDKESNIVQLTNSHYFDTFNQTLFFKENFIKLRALELEFLILLLQHKDRVVTYTEIEASVWDGDYMSEDALKSVVKSLRKKISKESIINHSKLGYKINLYHG